MSVAKSYVDLPIIEGPYIKDKREYVKVQKSNGKIQEVRWYQEPSIFNAHDAFGFGIDNFITIYNGKDKDIEEWRKDLPQYSVMYNTIFGWYSPSAIKIENAPAHFILKWDEIKVNNKEMKSHEEVRKYIQRRIKENGSIF